MSKVTCVYFSLHKNIFVLKKGTRKMNKLKELRKKVRKNNKGFSLVELIVVIVILAILIGVTIGGIYQYVNQSRINTDINNAASIQSVIATVATDAEVNKNLEKKASVTITWDAAKKTETEITSVTAVAGGTDTTKADSVKTTVVKKVSELLTDGLPASKSNGAFKIEIKKNEDGNVTATCKAYEEIACTNELTSKN